MATGESILKKMLEYEAGVLTALGFKRDDPVLLDSVDLVESEVRFRWYSDTDPEVPSAIYQPGVLIHAMASGEAIQYKVPSGAVHPDVWDSIVRAREEWASNFPRVTA